MKPVLRVVIPTASLTETTKDLGGEIHNAITRGLNSDYITDDNGENKSIPAAALYAARMDSRGVVTVIKGRLAGITAEHTYAGWPIPA